MPKLPDQSIVAGCSPGLSAGDPLDWYGSERVSELDDVCVFEAGVHRSNDGRELEYTDADLEDAVRNAQHILETHQPVAYVKPSHDYEAHLGLVPVLRKVGSRLYASMRHVAKPIAEQIRAGLRPWRSAEFVRNPEAWGYRGCKGLTLKALACIATHPSLKGLDSHSDSCGSLVVFADDGAEWVWYCDHQEDATVTEKKTTKPVAKFQEDEAKAEGEEGAAAGEKRTAEQVIADIKMLTMEEFQTVVKAIAEMQAGTGETEQSSERKGGTVVQLDEAKALEGLAKAQGDRAAKLEHVVLTLATDARNTAISRFCETHRVAPAVRAQVCEYISSVAGPLAVESFADGGDKTLAAAFDKAKALLSAAPGMTVPAGSLTIAAGREVEAFDEDKCRKEYLAMRGASAAGADAHVKAEKAKHEAQQTGGQR